MIRRNDKTPLEELDSRLAAIRDRVRGVASGHATGLYLCGRPGTSKTHTVRYTLSKSQIRYSYSNGHLTPDGLFDLLATYPDSVIILDDITQILKSQKAVQYLLAALGNPTDGGERVICRQTLFGVEQVWFKGGIILISNLELQGDATIDAIRSRIQSIKYDPSDEQLEALIIHLANQGLQDLRSTICLEVAAYTLEECRRLQVRPEVRLYVDKALPDYRLWATGDTELDWRDLITSSIKQGATDPRHTPQTGMTRAEQVAADRQLAAEIVARHETRQGRCKAWREATGKSERVLYRHIATLPKPR